MAEDVGSTVPQTVPGRNGGTLHSPWQPGQSGNPLGPNAPKRRLALALEQALNGRGGPKILADCLLDIAADPANRSAVAAIREVFDRLDGPVVKAQVTAHMDAHVERRKVRLVDYEVKPGPAAEPEKAPDGPESPSAPGS